MARATALPSHCFAKTSYYRILGQIPAGIGDLCNVHVHVHIYMCVYIYVIYIPWFQGVYGEFV